MTFVDTNVWIYAVGRSHPLRAEARAFLLSAADDPTTRLCTSAEVLQELLHVYTPVGRLAALDRAIQLARDLSEEIWSIDTEDVLLARASIARHPELGARDLLHLATCQRRGIRTIKTFDRALAAAFS